MIAATVTLSALHRDLHERLLASDAVAAQRSKAAAVAAVRCWLCVARAVDGWSGELTAAQQENMFTNIIAALSHNFRALFLDPAFSCDAAAAQGSPRVTGRRAVAAVIGVAEMAAEALLAVACEPPLRVIHHPSLSQGGASLPVGMCANAVDIVSNLLMQMVPGREVWLADCIEHEQMQPVLKALWTLLLAQVRWRAAWPCSGMSGTCVRRRLQLQMPFQHNCPSDWYAQTLLFTCASTNPRRPTLPSAAQGGGLAAGARQAESSLL